MKTKLKAVMPDAMSHMKYSPPDPLNIAVSRQATPEPKAKAKAKRKAKAKAKASGDILAPKVAPKWPFL